MNLVNIDDGTITSLSAINFEMNLKPTISNRKKISDWLFKLILFLLAGLGILTSYGWYIDAKL